MEEFLGSLKVTLKMFLSSLDIVSKEFLTLYKLKLKIKPSQTSKAQ